MATVYEINKGVGKSVEFKGIKAQYIIYLAVGVVILLLLFAILYNVGCNLWICLAIVLILGAGFIATIQRISKTYGEHGLQKKLARRHIPDAVCVCSRQIFINFNEQNHGKK